MRITAIIRRFLRAVVRRRPDARAESVVASLRIAEKIRKRPLTFTDDLISGAIRETNR